MCHSTVNTIIWYVCSCTPLTNHSLCAANVPSFHLHAHRYTSTFESFLYTTTFIETAAMWSRWRIIVENGFGWRVLCVCSLRIIFQFFSCNQLADQIGWDFIVSRRKNIFNLKKFVLIFFFVPLFDKQKPQKETKYQIWF